jgi:thiol-disulfide isomerase/thioredoxin
VKLFSSGDDDVELVDDTDDGVQKKLVLLYFCSDACGACKQFASTLENFMIHHRRGKGATKVDVLAISCDVDNSYGSLPAGIAGVYRLADEATDAARTRRRSTANAILRALRVSLLPTLVVVNARTGRVVTTWGRTVITLNARGALEAWERGESGLNPFSLLFRGCVAS